jgi:tripartite-type tricarboxylate transporter receptor subunit TctC
MLDPTTALAQVRAGLVKAYAVAATTRLSSAPEIPTVDEAGLPGFRALQWHGLWVPKGTPKDIIAKLNAAAVAALADAGLRKRLAALGQEIFPRDQQTPEALAAFAEGRDREMVADHQGGRHQGAVSHALLICAGNTVVEAS